MYKGQHYYSYALFHFSLFAGQFLGSSFLTVELISGSLSVDVAFDDVTSKTSITSKTGLLSDGKWHTVTLEVTLSVSSIALFYLRHSYVVVIVMLHYVFL